MNLELTLSSLQDKGYRLTKVRTEIIKIFSYSTEPLSANEIEKKLLMAKISANKATIYRELQFLLINNYIIEVYLHPSEVSYESSELKHHHHLVCDACGTIDSVTNCLASELEIDVYKKKGFKIKRHTLELYGMCSDCMRKNHKNI
jgi:Fur family ferric uptake transcriptional regulator